MWHLGSVHLRLGDGLGVIRAAWLAFIGAQLVGTVILAIAIFADAWHVLAHCARLLVFDRRMILLLLV